MQDKQYDSNVSENSRIKSGILWDIKSPISQQSNFMSERSTERDAISPLTNSRIISYT